MREDGVYGRIFDISVCKVIENRSKAIFVKSTISFGKTYCENEHLFQRDKTWKCAELSRPVSTNPQDVLILECELKFSDGSSSVEKLESSCVPASFINCNYFSSDMAAFYKSGNLTNVSIKVLSKNLRAQKFILSGRSSVFSRMFRTKMKESKKNIVRIKDVKVDIMDELLLYMYSGYLGKPLAHTVQELYVVADKYDVSALKKKCSCFLKENLAVTNLCNLLQLADLHSDGDLYNCVLTFIRKNSEVVFSSREWKNFVKGNLAAKILQSVIGSGKNDCKIV
ncbi:speckle-type POZ protein B-like [Stegodyphus dumicola]|uniref:speckle-type POZ protein B-like n=1 Tax=Stegodyphus dumicola TaxID=202533 RepID=UPI0015AFF268|nr:speckle-type POZ protein B-like [Stegodyphus dumicola]